MSRHSCWSPILLSTLTSRHCTISLASALKSRCLTNHSIGCFKHGRRERASRGLTLRADLYEVLNISPSATKAEVSASYRRLARRYHPDVNASEEALNIYEAIRIAYDILSDDARRKQYDAHGGGVRAGAGRNARPDAPEAATGGDVLTVVTLSFLEAALGKSHSLQVSAKRACPDCVGSGSRPGSRPVICELCRGSGSVKAHHAGYPGTRTVLDVACPACGATGIVRQEWCTRCGGDGRASAKVTLAISIPAGVDAESVLKLRGQGDAGCSGGASGDLYITFLVKASAGIRRTGLDLYSEVAVRYTDAILGVEAEVPTIHGQARLRIPAGTQSGQVLTMRGAGISPGAAGLASADGILRIGAGDSQRGAHHFTVIVLLPHQVSEEERMCLTQLRRLLEAAEWSRDMPCTVEAE